MRHGEAGRRSAPRTRRGPGILAPRDDTAQPLSRHAAPAAAAVALALAPVACGGAARRAHGRGPGATRAAPGTASTAPVPAGPASGAARTTTVATGLDVPWGIAFLPDGDALVSERDTGRILRVPARAAAARRAPARGDAVPGGRGQRWRGRPARAGGLAALRARPARLRLLHGRGATTASSASASAAAPHPILTGLRAAAIHNGGRIAFGPDGKLYAGVGETGDAGLAQDRGSRTARSCG